MKLILIRKLSLMKWKLKGKKCKKRLRFRGNPDQLRSFMMLRMRFKDLLIRFHSTSFSSFTRRFIKCAAEGEKCNRSRPSVPIGGIPDPLLQQLQEDSDRARSQRLQAELDQAHAKNARLLAFLQQATSQPKP
ncbi:hypothetical protein Dimus_013559 [Dionaea muscipula]